MCNITANRKMQMITGKATTCITVSFLEWPKSKKTSPFSKYWSSWNFPTLLCRVQNDGVSLEYSWAVTYRVKHLLTIYPEIPNISSKKDL